MSIILNKNNISSKIYNLRGHASLLSAKQLWRIPTLGSQIDRKGHGRGTRTWVQILPPLFTQWKPQ